MSEFKLPHVEDLATNSKLPGQLTENFEAIEQEDQQDDAQLNQEIKDRKDADSHLQEQIDKLNERVGTLESQIQQLQENDKDHEKRLKKIEELLFGSQPINASTVTVDNDSEHQGYDVADAPDYDYQEQEIN
ncbi:hypothetical protein [Limosilactobacillus reuteri]|uniref:hypothetical protein n=1 Tax=Limosilactobacillus reuteri TaxID=1598 RepID=UPI002B056089|nr:hypothetical protein [Limosilactobacillus reuteri]